jgi:Asp-tRNA(Asn)/Glu-tRNA(Gln) amidotransferase A subunit family amidase
VIFWAGSEVLTLPLFHTAQGVLMAARNLQCALTTVAIFAFGCLYTVRGFAQVAAAHATTFDLQTATVADINAAIDAGALSSEKLVRLYLSRIEAYDKKGPKINSVITLNPKALEEARSLDTERKAKGRRSPLHGIPIVVKDLVDVAGLPTTAAFTPFGAPIPERDAAIVTRLKAAGAIILAKVSAENWFGWDGFGATHPIGATLNPYNVEYSPGGSSNGPGASMASWFAAVGVGTDTGGSLQMPASYNSLVGMVATQGLVSRAGIVPRSLTQDRAGPLGRSVYDVAVMIDAMAGFDPEDLDTREGLGRYPQGTWAGQVAVSNLKKFRIGVLREAMSTLPANAEAQPLFDAALEDMRKAGAQVLDPVVSGIDLARQSDSSSIGVWPYEVIIAGDIYLKRLGPKRPFKTMKEMIATVGPDKFVDSYVSALSYPPLQEDPDSCGVIVGARQFVTWLKVCWPATIWTRLLFNMSRRLPLPKMFLAPPLQPVDVIHARFGAAALSLPLAFPESLCPRVIRGTICRLELSSSGNRSMISAYSK